MHLQSLESSVGFLETFVKDWKKKLNPGGKEISGFFVTFAERQLNYSFRFTAQVNFRTITFYCDLICRNNTTRVI